MNGDYPMVGRAPVVPLRVVAAKKRGGWIVRAMSPFMSWETLRSHAERYVGTLDETVEWTQYEYEGWPSYVVYGEGDLDRLGWPTGVYKFDCKWSDQDKEGYGPAQKLGDVR